MRRWPTYASILVALCLVAAACSGTGSATTTLAPDVEFGEGEVPETVPDDFPIMPGTLVSSTLVNRDNGFTEMILRMPVELGVAVQYYTQNLEGAGYSIEESVSSSDSIWDITATGSGVAVEIGFRLMLPEVTQAAVSIEPQS